MQNEMRMFALRERRRALSCDSADAAAAAATTDRTCCFRHTQLNLTFWIVSFCWMNRTNVATQINQIRFSWCLDSERSECGKQFCVITGVVVSLSLRCSFSRSGNIQLSNTIIFCVLCPVFEHDFFGFSEINAGVTVISQFELNLVWFLWCFASFEIMVMESEIGINIHIDFLLRSQNKYQKLTCKFWKYVTWRFRIVFYYRKTPISIRI